jgi:general secretion pathway protein G
MASRTVNGDGVMRKQGRSSGFTLIELLVVMSVIALLLSIAVPRYFQSVDKAREAVLKEDLSRMRGAIDQFFADRGVYPLSLDELVDRDYVRRIPEDPITESKTTWVIVAPRDPELSGVFDIKSGAPGVARDGSAYSDW